MEGAPVHCKEITISGWMLAMILACSGCTIQDVFRSTLGGVNSDRAALNKVNPANEYSFPQTDDDRTELKWPKSDS